MNTNEDLRPVMGKDQASTAFSTEMSARGETTAGSQRADHPAQGRGNSLVIWVSRNRQLAGLILSIVVVLVVGSVTSDVFLTKSNFYLVSSQTAITALLGVAVTIGLVAGVIDFSVGAIVAVSTVIIAQNAGESFVLTVLLLMLLVLIVTLVKGVLLSYLGLETFIATLALSLVIEGIAVGMSEGQSIPVNESTWLALGSSDVLGMPVAPILVLAFAFILAFVMRSTVWGKALYATGGNPIAAEIAGIRTRRVKTQALAICTGLAVIAGVLFVGRVGSADPHTGTQLTLDAIVVAVLGGASLFGGRGRVLGALLGAVLLGLLFNLFILLNMPQYSQMIIRGIILIAAISLDAARRRE